MRSAVRREHFANCFLADDAMMSPYANFFFHRHIRKAVANEQTAPTLTAIGSIPIPTLALKVIAKLVGFYYWRHLVSRGKSGLSPQNDNVLFAQSRNVLLTPSRLERWQKDNY
jgi:hypothetical protein